MKYFWYLKYQTAGGRVAEELGLARLGLPGSADASVRRPYLAGLIWLNASRHSAGTHLSAMTQKSLQGGWPV